MLFAFVCVLLLGFSSSYMMPKCKFIYTETTDDNPIAAGSCRYTNGYIFSSGTELQTPFPDCNKCYCYNGVMKCCLFGIKKGPIAVDASCEIQQLDGTCYYRIVKKHNKNIKC